MFGMPFTLSLFRNNGRQRQRPDLSGIEKLEDRTLLSFAAPFSSLLSAPSNLTPQMLAVADFRGDGHRDLAVGTGGAVDIFLGNGDGSLRSAGSVTGTRPPPTGPVAAGDFTGNGRSDLVIGSTDHLEIFLSNGNGTFRDGGSIVIGDDVFPTSIAVADFHGDGRQDIVVTLDIGTVLEFVGNGNGTFQAPVTIGNFDPSGFFAVVAGDVNNNGKQDLIVGTATTAQLLAGNGDGTFQTPVPFAPGFPLAVTDANGDGIPDLVFATPSGIRERLGNGAGTFQDPVDINFAAGTPVTVIGAGDFTTNGQLDAVVANIRPPAIDTRALAVSVLLNNGDGSLATAPAYATGQFPRQLVAGDFSGSGLPDLVTTDSDHIHLLPNNGDGTFGSPITLADGAFGQLIARDFTGNGHLDLAALTRTPQGLLVEVFPGNGDGTFQTPRISFAGSSSLIPAQMVAGDFEGNGNLDLAIVANDETPGHFQGVVTVLLGNGDGTFRLSETHQVADPFTIVTGLAVGNFTGALDLVETNRDGTVNVLRGNGDGTFQDPVAFQVGGTPSSVAAADLRGNGITDLIITSTGPTSSTVNVLLGNGDGTFQDPIRIAVGMGASSVVVGDFNGDLIPDIAVISSGNTVSVLLGNGDGTFQDPLSYLAGDIPMSLVAADFNGDGAFDLATANFHSANVSVLLNRNDGAGPLGGGAETHVRPNASSAALGEAERFAAVDVVFADAAVDSRNPVLFDQEALSASAGGFSASSLQASLPPARPSMVDAATRLAQQERGRIAEPDAIADPLPGTL